MAENPSRREPPPGERVGGGGYGVGRDVGSERVIVIHSAPQIQPPQPQIQPPPPVYNVTFNISGGSFSQLNAAVETVQNIANRLSAVSVEGQPDLATALREVGQAILDDANLNQQKRSELVENIDDLSEQAQLPQEQRKQGRVRAAIASIAAAAVAGSRLHETWTAWEPTVRQLLPH